MEENNLEEITSELNDLPEAFENLTENIALYDSELNQLETNLKELTYRSKTELDELNALKCFYNSTKLKTDTTEADVQLKTYQMNSLINEVSRLKIDNLNLDSKLIELNDLYYQRSNEIEHLRNCFKDYEIKLNGLKQSLIESDKEVANLKSVIFILENNKLKLENEIPKSYLTLSNDDISKEVSILKTKAALLNSLVDDLNDEIELMRNQIEKTQKTNDMKILSSLELAKSNLRKEIESKKILYEKRLELEKKINLLQLKLNR